MAGLEQGGDENACEQEGDAEDNAQGAHEEQSEKHGTHDEPKCDRLSRYRREVLVHQNPYGAEDGPEEGDAEQELQHHILRQGLGGLGVGQLYSGEHEAYQRHGAEGDHVPQQVLGASHPCRPVAALAHAEEDGAEGHEDNDIDGVRGKPLLNNDAGEESSESELGREEEGGGGDWKEGEPHGVQEVAETHEHTDGGVGRQQPGFSHERDATGPVAQVVDGEREEDWESSCLQAAADHLRLSPWR